jgi:exopolysaccharide production protein ExoY
MITELSKARSTFRSLTGGGSYPDSRGASTGAKSYARITPFEKKARATRKAKKTAAISLQANYLLSLLPRDAAPARVPGAESAGETASGAAAGTGSRLRAPGWKRSLDLACTLVSMPVWLVAMGFIALWIKLTSEGPVFYRQTRVGLGGRSFTILKFRSMKTNAETKSHTDHVEKLISSNASMVKLDALGDSRMIPGGCILRASGLDELPQIFNVLRGEMSLVGPRPCLPAEFERYEDWHKARVFVPPGLTGYWQVNGKNKTSFKQMVELDLLYAERMSLGLDLAVMVATVPALLLQFVETRNRCVREDRRQRGRVPGAQPSREHAEPDSMETIAKAA